ncbi:MAG: helix-turn-helix transcriptional regulator, partial [Waterburya sp.]
ITQKFDLTERDRLILNLLQPHLILAYQAVQHLQELQQQLAQLQHTLDRAGIIFLDGLGQVQLMTSQAATWLQSYFPPHNGFKELPEQLHSWIKYQFAQFQAIDDDLSTPCLPLHVQKENRRLTIRLVMDRPGEQYLLLLAEEQVVSWLNVLELLGLSHREAEILACIIQGQDNKAIAMQLSIHVSTVRKHLENIYHKLDVQSRTEAIALALEKLGCLQLHPLV